MLSQLFITIDISRRMNEMLSVKTNPVNSVHKYLTKPAGHDKVNQLIQGEPANAK